MGQKGQVLIMVISSYLISHVLFQGHRKGGGGRGGRRRPPLFGGKLHTFPT